MSSAMRNFMEAYSAVHNSEAKQDFYNKKDELSEMDLSLISDVELDEIAESALQDLFDQGFSIDQASAIFDHMIAEAKVSYGHDTESPRAAKVQRMKGALKGAVGKARMTAARGAVKAYGTYRNVKQAADIQARRTAQTAKNISAQTAKKASEAKAGAKSGLKGMIKKAAEKVVKRMSEEAIDEATAMAKRGYDEAPIRQKIAKSTGGGKAADRATALEKKPTFGDAKKEKQRQDLARKQRGDFRKTTSSSPGLHGYGYKSDDSAVKAKQAARGAQRSALTPNEKKELNREEFVSEKKGDGNLANNYPPYDKVTRGDVIAGATGKDQMGGKNIRGNNSAEQKARLEKKRGMKLDDHPQFKEQLEASGKFTAQEIERIIENL